MTSRKTARPCPRNRFDRPWTGVSPLNPTARVPSIIREPNWPHLFWPRHVNRSANLRTGFPRFPQIYFIGYQPKFSIGYRTKIPALIFFEIETQIFGYTFLGYYARFPLVYFLGYQPNIWQSYFNNLLTVRYKIITPVFLIYISLNKYPDFRVYVFGIPTQIFASTFFGIPTQIAACIFLGLHPRFSQVYFLVFEYWNRKRLFVWLIMTRFKADIWYYVYECIFMQVKIMFYECNVQFVRLIFLIKQE